MNVSDNSERHQCVKENPLLFAVINLIMEILAEESINSNEEKSTFEDNCRITPIHNANLLNLP